MIKFHPQSTSLVALSFLSAALLGCTSDSGGDEPELGTGELSPGGAGERSPGGAGAAQGDCSADVSANALFAPLPFGADSNDLVRRVELDPETGDLWFSTWRELYRLPNGSDEPVEVLARPSNASPQDGVFWLLDDEVLLPAAGGSQRLDSEIPGVTAEIMPVLLSAPRESGEATLRVGAPTPQEGVSHRVVGSTIVGDDIYWVDYSQENNDFSMGPPPRTYRARRNSWRSPAPEPIELHSSDRDLYVPIVAGDLAFVGEQNDEDDGLQRIIHLDDGSLDPLTAQERFGGRVIAADGESLIVSNNDFADLLDYEVFRVALDGSQRERIAQYNPLPAPRANGGVWAFNDFDTQIRAHRIYVYEVGSEPRAVACFSNDYTVHDVVPVDGAVLVAVFDDDNRATILRYPY